MFTAALILSLGIAQAGSLLGPAPIEAARAESAWVANVERPMMSSRAALPEDGRELPPIYLVAPVNPSSSQVEGKWGLGPVDQVMPVLPRAEARVRVFLVCPGPKFEASNASSRIVEAPIGAVRLLFAADLDGSGVLRPLTSTERIETAVEKGIARARPLDFSLRCLLMSR